MHHGNRLIRLLTAGLLLTIAGCASVPQSVQLAKAPGDLPRRILLNEVAFFPQVKYQCGPAALATLLTHNGVEIVPDELVDKVYIPKRQGSLQVEMIATARSYGLLPYPLEKQLKALLTELASGNPVLVFQNLALAVWPEWHYAVAVGYDLDSAELILRSGTYREHRLSIATFERTWQRADYWAYAIMPAGDIPVTATPKNYLPAAYDLEASGFKQLARESYRAAVDKWPDNSAALMALGNSEYSMGDMPRAQTAFTRAIQLNPEDEAAWNNLAYALAGNGCHRAAVLAVQCAAKLSPTDNNIKHSLSELSASTQSDGSSCETLTCPVEHLVQ